MTYFFRHPWGRLAGMVVVSSALVLGACSTTVSSGPGGSGASGGHDNTGGASTGGTGTGGATTSSSSTGGSVPVDCVTAENFDPCASPGSYCSYYDASTNEYCDAYCDDTFHWQKYCYSQPTYCYNPSLCPTAMPSDGGSCPTTSECEYYDCEYFGACGGSGYGYASCQGGIWFTYEDCYCFQPPDLCPTAPPQNGTPCASTSQCQTYDCEWYGSCGNNTYDFAMCDGGFWYSSGDCI